MSSHAEHQPSAAPSRRGTRVLTVAIVVLAVVGAGALAPQAVYYLLPPGLSGEADRLAAVLELSPGMVVAEIGAGSGALTAELARRVGPAGRVYSTELSQARLADIRDRVRRERLDNVIVIEAGDTATGLPDACCAAIVLRNVYHHIGDPRAFNVSLRQAVAARGRVAIIDFEPGTLLFLSGTPAAAAPRRGGHGVRRAEIAAELGEAGFEVEREIADWGGRSFLVLLRAR